MLEREYTIEDPKGLHVAPSIAISNASRDSEVEVKLAYSGRVTDADVFSLLERRIPYGQTIRFQVEGPSQDSEESFFRNIESNPLINLRRRQKS